MKRIPPLCSLLLITACATATPLQGSREAPAARGTVDFKSGDNGNTQMDIKVEHLASPSELRVGDLTYVVWVQGYGNLAAQNVGALTVDGNLVGHLKTVTPLHAFQLYVTPEPSASVSNPTGPRVLSASYSG